MFWLAAMSAVVAAATGLAQTRETVEKTIWDGVYTSEQADRGQLALQQRCTACHAHSEWSSATFINRWAGRSILTLYDTIRLTMPYNAPAGLSREQYSDIVASMLRLNGAPPGDVPLPNDVEGLQHIAVTPKGDR
jgi:S-disulfanyl-L-cysteine oxidoreductase SoxD